MRFINEQEIYPRFPWSIVATAPDPPSLANLVQWLAIDSVDSFLVKEGFTGTGDDSGSVGDSNFNTRWTRTVSPNPPSSEVIDSGWYKMNFAVPTTQEQRLFLDHNIPNLPGVSEDFAFGATVNVSNVTDPNPYGPYFLMLFSVGGTNYQLGWLQSGNEVLGLTYYNGSNYVLIETNRDGGQWDFLVRRTGSTLTFSINGDTKWTTTNTGAVGYVSYWPSNRGNSGGGTVAAGADIWFTDVVANDNANGDGTGVDMYYDISLWSDKTVNENDSIQATVGVQPSFDGTDVIYDSSDYTAAGFSLSAGFSFVEQFNISKPAGTLIIKGDSNTYLGMDSNGYLIGYAGSTITNSFDYSNTPGVYTFTHGASSTFTTFDFDFTTLTLPDTINDRSGSGSRIKCDETLANGGTRYEVPPWWVDGGQGREVWYWMVQSGALSSYGTKDFSFSVEAFTENIANLTQKGYGGVDMFIILGMSDGSSVAVGKRHNNTSNFWGDYYRFNLGTLQLIQGGEFDIDTTFELRRNGNNLEAWYGGVLKGTGSTSASATIDYVYLHIANTGGWALYDLPGNTWYATWRNFTAKDEFGQPLAVENQFNVSKLYKDGVEIASGDAGTNTLGSMQTMSNGLVGTKQGSLVYDYPLTVSEVIQATDSLEYGTTPPDPAANLIQWFAPDSINQIELNDDFSTLDLTKWVQNEPAGGTNSIESGKLKLYRTGNSNYEYNWVQTGYPEKQMEYSGDFDITMPFEGLLQNDYFLASIGIVMDGKAYAAAMAYESTWGLNNGPAALKNVTWVYDTSQGYAPSGSFGLSLSGTTLSFLYNDVVFDTDTVAGTLDRVNIQLEGRNNSGDIQMYVDNISGTDANGDPLIIGIEDWSDKSGEANDLTQSTIAYRPKYVLNGANSYSVARFDATDTMASSLALPQPFTLHATVKLTTPGTTQVLMGDSNAGIRMNSSGHIEAYAGSIITDSVDYSGSWVTISMTADGTNSNLYINGSKVATGDIGAGNISAVSLIAATLEADVAEARAYDAAQNATTVASIASDLSIYL